MSEWPRDPDAKQQASPLSLHDEIVRPEWVDYNGHMNVAYYVLVFDHATDAFLHYLDLGEAYRWRTNASVFVAEAHVTYEAEVRTGDRVSVSSRLLGFDGKRLILFHEMFEDGNAPPVATNELLCLHVDLESRRTASLPTDAARKLQDLAADHARLPRPGRAGRAIGLASRKPT